MLKAIVITCSGIMAAFVIVKAWIEVCRDERFAEEERKKAGAAT